MTGPERAPRRSSVGAASLYARPQRLRIICAAAGAFVVLAFAVSAIALPSAHDGFHFLRADQISIFLVGVAVAGMFWLPTRPRVRADTGGVDVRGIVGGYKSVPWDLIQSVEFRPRWHWARLVLPADETISLYAVQRLDGPSSIAAMRALRALQAQVSETKVDNRQS